MPQDISRLSLVTRLSLERDDDPSQEYRAYKHLGTIPLCTFAPQALVQLNVAMATFHSGLRLIHQNYFVQ